MCNYQTLYQDEQGACIILCNQCNQVQVAFGIVVLTLTRNEFHSFNNNLQNHYEQEKSGQRTIVFTSCKSVTLLLNSEELTFMKKVIDTAETELRTLELISLFN